MKRVLFSMGYLRTIKEILFIMGERCRLHIYCHWIQNVQNLFENLFLFMNLFLTTPERDEIPLRIFPVWRNFLLFDQVFNALLKLFATKKFSSSPINLCFQCSHPFTGDLVGSDPNGITFVIPFGYG